MTHNISKTILAILLSVTFFLVAISAAAQVKTGTADLNPPGMAPASSWWTDQDERIINEMLGGAEKVANPIGGVSSHGGSNEALNQIGEYYRNLSKGLNVKGDPISGHQWGGYFRGANKREQWEAFKQQCGKMADNLDRLGKAITFVDSGAKVFGHLAEKDVGGALITTNDELAKVLALILAGAGGGSVGGPFGAFTAAGATEEAWATTGHAYFEWEKQRLRNLEKIAAHAGKRVTDPDIKAYMRGDISATELKAKLLEKRQAAVEKWRRLAEIYPEIKDDVEALVALNATARQRAKLLYVSRLDGASRNDPELQDALRAWLAGKYTRVQLNQLRAALGLPPIVDLDPTELVGLWGNGTFVITDAPLIQAIRSSIVQNPGSKPEALESCDMIPPEAIKSIADTLDRLRGQTMALTIVLDGDGTKGALTLRITPPEGFDASANRPVIVPYRFAPNKLSAEGLIQDNQGYMTMKATVVERSDLLVIHGTWELRGASKQGGRRDTPMMLGGTWSGQKARSAMPSSARPTTSAENFVVPRQ